MTCWSDEIQCRPVDFELRKDRLHLFRAFDDEKRSEGNQPWHEQRGVGARHHRTRQTRIEVGIVGDAFKDETWWQVTSTS